MNNEKTENAGKILTRIQLLFSLGVLILLLVVKLGVFVEALGLILAASICAVVIITPLVIKFSAKAGAIDYPDERRIHLVPTSRWGGLAVSTGVTVALLLTSIHYVPNLRALLTGAYLILLVGLLDDIKRINVFIKLLVQLVACVILIANGICVTFPPAAWWGGVQFQWIVMVLWIVGITNAMNFLDGMDGLLSGLVMGMSLIYFVLALLLGSNMLAYCSLALFGAAFAFLGFNIKPVRIFLGDGGSTFFGFFLAALSVQGGWAEKNPLVSFFIPIFILSVPIYDMVFTTVARIATRKVTTFRSWLEYTGKDHLHHRLEALGLSRGQVVMAICFLNMGVGLGAITLFEARTYGGITLLFQIICIYMVIALLEILAMKKTHSMVQGSAVHGSTVGKA
ncbi:MAG: undecaprenyl/decaprenyl-phosphate alpha-N-acetylglucosaminyl 1-phosphate transferase [Kiritimatiellae bacterium]|nr:undecaprenyl/decaprenyl-phosphate alpha-N-acetylglucosaminyl 1-phosphate transferase [Kiritimatiellia bacterium]